MIDPDGTIEALKAQYPLASRQADVVGEILAERAKRHGDFTDHAEITQRIKQVFYGSPNWHILTNTQKEGLEMAAHKIGRILAGDPNHADHWLDIEGYIRIARERLGML